MMDHCYDIGFSRRIEDRRYDDTLRKCLDSDSINRRYENDSNLLRRYESNTDTIKSIQNDLKKFDHSLNNTLRSEKCERNGNENVENRKRLDSSALLMATTDGINLSAGSTLSRKLNNYDNTRKLDECTLTRRIRDDVNNDISCTAMSERGNH